MLHSLHIIYNSVTISTPLCAPDSVHSMKVMQHSNVTSANMRLTVYSSMSSCLFDHVHVQKATLSPVPEETPASCISAAPDQVVEQVDTAAADTTKKNCRRSLDFDV